MRKKGYYFILTLILGILTVFILKVPSFYFEMYDKKQKEHYQVQKLNLTNIYDNYQLSIDKKLKILSDADKTQLFFVEELSKSKYLTVLEHVLEELKKINEDLEKSFREYFSPNYEEIQYLSMARGYISCDDYGSLTLRLVHYETNAVSVVIMMDIYDATEDGESFAYYPLKNNTTYEETTYYPLSFYQKEIVIENEESYPTMLLDVHREEKSGVYDIVLDPGHGGMDGGAVNGNYKESTLTYELASLLKKDLEKYGFKVKLTHQGNIPLDELMDNYNTYGRSVIPQKVKAKYLFSLHFNSSTAKYVQGLEIYTANHIKYDFAKQLATNLVRDTGLEVSSNMSYRIEDGIYSRNFTEKEIKESKDEAIQKGRTPYSITTDSNYFYMIRETGGFMTGAYVDERNASSVGENPYYNSNIGVESYILELGFITNRADLNNFLEKKEQYANSLANSIYEELKKKSK